MLAQELHDIRVCLKGCLLLNTNEAEVRSDSLCAVNILLGKENILWYCENLVEAIKLLMVQFNKFFHARVQQNK